MQEKLKVIDSNHVGKQNTLPTKNAVRYVRYYTLLDPLYWTSGILNDMFVSGHCGLASLPFHPQRSRYLQHAYASVC